MKRLTSAVLLAALLLGLPTAEAAVSVNNVLNNPFSQAATVPASGITGTVAVANGGTNGTAFTAPAAGITPIVYFDGTKLTTDPVPGDLGYNPTTNTFSIVGMTYSGQLTSTVATGTAPLVVASATPVAGMSIGGNSATSTTATNQSGGTVSATTISASGTTTLHASIVSTDSANGINSGATSGRLRLSGGSPTDGAVIVLGGSTDIAIPSTGLLSVGATTILSWTGTSVSTSTPVNITGTISATGGYASPLLISTGAVANQLRLTQTTPPTCTTNCGTGGTVTGSDDGGGIVIGATGTPASGFLITFNGAWPAKPNCTVTAAKAGMTAFATIAATTTTTMTIYTAAAPANSDEYSYHCTVGQ